MLLYFFLFYLLFLKSRVALLSCSLTCSLLFSPLVHPALFLPCYRLVILLFLVDLTFFYSYPSSFSLISCFHVSRFPIRFLSFSRHLCFLILLFPFVSYISFVSFPFNLLLYISASSCSSFLVFPTDGTPLLSDFPLSNRFSVPLSLVSLYWHCSSFFYFTIFLTFSSSVLKLVFVVGVRCIINRHHFLIARPFPILTIHHTTHTHTTPPSLSSPPPLPCFLSSRPGHSPHIQPTKLLPTVLFLGPYHPISPPVEPLSSPFPEL